MDTSTQIVVFAFSSFAAGYIASWFSYRLFLLSTRKALNRLDVIIQKQNFLIDNKGIQENIVLPPVIEENWTNEGRPRE